MKAYAVSIERNSVDYILVSALNEDDAKEKAQSLIDEGTETITLGMDGTDDEILSATESEADSEEEQADLKSNNDLIAELEAEDNASV